MKYGLDSSQPPTPERAKRLWSLGWSFYGGYIGGRTPLVWTFADWNVLAKIGFEPLPIWVAPTRDSWTKGADDGAACIDALAKAGLSGNVVIDLEDGAVLPEYLSAFVSALNTTQHQVTLYGLRNTLRELARPELVDWSWLAFWPVTPFVENGAPPDWDVWQFASGESADYSVARNAFPFASYANVHLQTRGYR